MPAVYLADSWVQGLAMSSITEIPSATVVLLNNLTCPWSRIMECLIYQADKQWIESAILWLLELTSSAVTVITLLLFFIIEVKKQPLSGCLLFRAALLSIFKTYREKRHTKKEQLGMVFSALRSEGIQCMWISKYITIYQAN